MSQLTYEAALEWIHSRGRWGIKPGLERMNALLERLGMPHRKLKFVHVGGSNGKGSTSAMVVSMLREAGYRVGLYTSPYLESFTNRMAVNGADISGEELVRQVELVRPLVEEIAVVPELGQPTEFEVVTVLAFNYFAACSPDLVVLEVGLGGRLDATNVIEPLLSVITNISLEHTLVLGSTLEEIAREKAGIIKKGAPLITASAEPAVLQVFRETARQRGSAFCRVISADNGDSGVESEKQVFFGSRRVVSGGQTMDYRGLEWGFEGLFIPLMGDYQVDNAATAVAVLEHLNRMGIKTTGQDVIRGMKEVRWPGRLEVVGTSPLMVMDGAHNPAAMEGLSRAVREHFHYRRLILVMGILDDKDSRKMMESIVPLADELVLTRPAIPRAMDPEQLKRTAEALAPIKAHVNPSVSAAMDTAVSLAAPEDMILVTGSFYTVSDARKVILPREK